jgi:hypothetical protein
MRVNRKYVKQITKNAFPNVAIVRDATMEYNCHAYVHAERHAWSEKIDQFLADDYEQYTPGTLLVDMAVVYVKNGVIQHSGFITKTDGKFVQEVSQNGDNPPR